MALFAIALIAFTVEGTLGFGSTVIAVSLGAQLVPLDALLPAFVPLNIVLSLSLLRRPIAWRELARMAPPLSCGIAAGIALSRVIAAPVLLAAFGCFVAALALWQLVRRAPRGVGHGDTETRRRGLVWLRPLLVLGGVVHGLFGTGGPLIIVDMRGRIPDKTQFRSSLAIVWVVLNTALLASFHQPPSVLTLWMGAAIVPGILLGNWLHNRLDAQRFERAISLLLLVAGVVLAIRHV